MPNQIQEPVKKAMARAADVIYADTAQNLPVDEGDLVRSLHKAKSSNGFNWRVGWWKKGNKRKWRLAGWRAHFNEFGTKGYSKGDTRRSKTSKTTSKIKRNLGAQAANPTLGPAYRKNEKWIIGHIKAAVNRALRQASEL